MNLVQINERLKNLPMQVIQQYANGMNPEVPPYLALGELQRREASQKQAATAQGGQQGPQPSIKEQIEQKSGLMALQQMQQQQMAQQQQQPQGPMPVPAGAPQPEMQPQPEMMARGGLAGIPVRRDMFEYAGGGIIAFSGENGSQVKKPIDGAAQKALEEAQRSSDRNAMTGTLKKLAAAGYDVATLIPRAAMGVVEDLSNTRLGRALGIDFELPQSAYGGDRASMTPMLDRVQREEPKAPTSNAVPASIQASYSNEGRQPPVGLPEALKKAAADKARPPISGPAASPIPSAQRPTQAAAPVPAPTAAQALPNEPVSQAGLPAAAQSINPYEARLNQVALKKPVAPTTQDAINRIKELSPDALQEDFIKKRMQEQRDRAAAERAAFQESRPSGLDNLIRVLGQAGQYKGFSGIGPAYTANKQQQRAEELAMEKRQNELLNAIDTGEYERGKALFTARTGAFDTAQQLFGKEKDNVVNATAKLYETTQSRINNELKMLSDKEIKQLQIAADKEKTKAEQKGQTARTQMQINAANARDPDAKIAEYVGLRAKARELMELGGTENIKKANSLFARAEDMKEYGGKGLRGGSANADKQELAELKTLLKNAEDTAGNFALPKAARDEAVRRMSEINNQIASMTKLGSSTTSAPSGKVPAVGTVMDGYRFKGGNPANQSNWEKV